MAGPEAIIGAAIIGGGSQIIGGIQANREARRQARTARQEAGERARAEEREVRKRVALQRVGFLKSGVFLEGTPLEVLEETELLGAQDVEAIRRGGEATARSLRASGRARLIGGIGSGVSSFGTGAFRASQLGF